MTRAQWRRAERAMRERAEHRAMVGRILATIDAATVAEAAAGADWYSTAAAAAGRLSGRHSVTLETAAAVVAALSPRQQWRANVNAAERVLAAWTNGAEHAPRVGLGANVRTAWRACSQGTSALRGDKVRSFAAAILGDRDSVTVDVWAARCALGPSAAIPSLRGARYARIADAYRAAASLRGMSARDCQAVAWVVTRGQAD